MSDANSPQYFGEHLLNLSTNRIHDMPDVVVNPARPRCVNVLIPAFDFNSMSAGFFGVFQIAKFIAKCGLNVRLVLFDNFYFDESLFRTKLLGYPGMEELFDELETTYIGERLTPLEVSRDDNCVATVWYSAYFARKIMDTIGGKPFLYLIQDYETNFYPGGSLFQFAEATYSFNYSALFSTKTLRDFFLSSRIGRFATSSPSFIFFNNACASSLPDRTKFLSRSREDSRRLVFYSRPVVSRNMFELGALALCRASARGLFKPKQWELIGIGLGTAEIDLGEGIKMRQMARMNLKEYQEIISTFDIGLTLMASPHPSLLPFDLAGSGSIVVTNTFRTKQQSYFDKISSNIIAADPNLDDIVDSLDVAVTQCEDFDRRYAGARDMMYPREWAETFGHDHVAFIRSVFKDTLND